MSNTNAERRAVNGLCAGCNHLGTCMYMRLPRTAVWHCEEFDGVSAPPAVAMPAPAQALMITDLAVPGLCANCEQRDTCTFPKQVGGVWHCEEYR